MKLLRAESIKHQRASWPCEAGRYAVAGENRSWRGVSRWRARVAFGRHGRGRGNSIDRAYRQLHARQCTWQGSRGENGMKLMYQSLDKNGVILRGKPIGR